MSDRNYNRRDRPRGGRGGGRGSGHGNGRGGFEKKGKEKFQNKGNERRDEPRKELSFYFKESKDKKEFKVVLGENESEKVQVPSYGDNDQDETLLLLIKDFNLMVEDGDLLKEEAIGSEQDDRPFTAANNMRYLVCFKYRTLCL